MYKRKNSRSTKNQGAQERKHKSAKFKAQKRARKRQREELRQRARSVKKSACPALVFSALMGQNTAEDLKLALMVLRDEGAEGLALHDRVRSLINGVEKGLFSD